MAKPKKTFTDEKILAAMSREAQTPASVAQKLKCSSITISRALPRLYEDGLVEKITIKGANKKTIVGWYTELTKKQRARL